MIPFNTTDDGIDWAAFHSFAGFAIVCSGWLDTRISVGRATSLPDADTCARYRPAGVSFGTVNRARISPADLLRICPFARRSPSQISSTASSNDPVNVITVGLPASSPAGNVRRA